MLFRTLTSLNPHPSHERSAEKNAVALISQTGVMELLLMVVELGAETHSSTLSHPVPTPSSGRC